MRDKSYCAPLTIPWGKVERVKEVKLIEITHILGNATAENPTRSATHYYDADGHLVAIDCEEANMLIQLASEAARSEQ